MFIIICLLLLFVILVYIQNNESFIDFGTPQDSSDDDKDSIKDLLEIGSQSVADSEYDQVSTEILGEIDKISTEEEDIEPEDPICFLDPYSFEYSNLSTYRSTGGSCNLKPPSMDEIDADFSLWSETEDYIDETIPPCCG